MTIFDFPAQAEDENGIFSVLDREKHEELLFFRRRPYRLPENAMLVRSQLCGGDLRSLLEDACRQYGDRLWFLIEPLCAVLPLPCPDARETVIPLSRSLALRAENPILPCRPFCCEYCIFFKENEPFLHLFDTERTILQKLSLAQSLGAAHCIVMPIGQKKTL